MSTHYEQQNNKIRHFVIISISLSTILGSFWLIFGSNQEFPTWDQIASNTQIQKSTEKEIESTDKNQEPFRDFLDPDEYSNQKSESQNSEPTVSDSKPEFESSKISRDNEERKIDELESSIFVLDVRGEGYEATPRLSEPAILRLEMTPFDDKISVFDISQTTLAVGGGAYPVDGGRVVIDNQEITVDFQSPESWDMPDIVLSGTLDEGLLKDSDGEIQVNFEDQLIFLTNGDTIPTHLNLHGTLSIEST